MLQSWLDLGRASWAEVQPHLPWLLTMIAGALGIAIAGHRMVLWLLESLMRRYRRWVERHRRPEVRTYRDAWLQKHRETDKTWWERYRTETERLWREAGVPIKAEAILGIQAALAVMGAAVALVALKNPVFALILAGGGAWLPSQFLRWGKERSRRTIQADLIKAVHFFSTEFSETRHVARALILSSRKLPGLVAEVFERSGRRLQAGEDYRGVLDDMATQLKGHPYAVLFGQLCQVAIEDSSVAPMFSSLVVRLNERVLLERRARTAFSGVRTVSYTLNIAAIPAVILGIYLVPDGYSLYTQTTQGKAVVILSGVLILVGFWFNRASGRIPDV